jgi:hypothetical protein
MRTFADNPAILSSLTPNQLRAYLTTTHWTFAQPFLDHGELWVPQSDRFDPNPIAQILLPSSSSLGDYLPRIREALAVLEILEHRSQAEILLDILPIIPHFQTQGIITNLYEGAREGRVTLMGVVLGKLRRIHLDLPDPIYETAIQAYRGRIPVTCQGSLRKQDETLDLIDLRQFAFDIETPVFATAGAG